jgi:tRNA threonylcarbamoyladenosine biosynthesis protein TsaE
LNVITINILAINKIKTKMKIRIESLDTINEAAREFIKNMGEYRVFAFYGKMGAGKTTFIKALCKQLGSDDNVTSPTFAIVNEYTAEPSGDPIYHFDFYRIKKLEEVYDMGYEEYFDSGNICLIEWPELIEDLLPLDAAKVTITEQPDGSRLIEMNS